MPAFENPLEKFERENRELLRSVAKENAKLVDALRELKRFEPFSVYVDALNRMIQLRADELMSPLPDVNAVLKQEHLKGAMYGLILARDLPAITLSAMEDSARDEDER